MASEVTLGSFTPVGGSPVQVIRDDDRTVCFRDSDTAYAFFWLDAHAVDQLRELLDRAAMPGQAEAHAAPAISETDT